MWAKIWARGVINDGVGRPASRAINFSTYGVKYPLYRLCSSLIFQSSPVITPRHRGEPQVQSHSSGVALTWMHRATFDLVWLGVLILTPGVGVPAGPVCPAFPLRFRLGLSAGGRVRPVGVVPGWPGTAGTRPAPTASAAEGASGGGGRSGPAEPGC